MTITQALTLAIQHLQTGRLAEAEQVYRAILQADPNQPAANHWLGVVLDQRGQSGSALEFMQRSVDVAPRDPTYRNNLGILLGKQGRRLDALAAFRAAVELDPAFLPARMNLGMALHQQGRLDDAAAAFRQVVAYNPAHADALNSLGLVLKDLGRSEEAIPFLRQALTLRPDFFEACNNLGIVLQELGRCDDSAAAFTRALQLRPDSADAHNNLGVLWRKFGRLEAALTEFREALRLRPGYAFAQRNLAAALADVGQFDEAIAAFHEALRLAPDDPELPGHLALTLARFGAVDEAIAACQVALPRTAEPAEVHRTWGNALLASGRQADAIAEYRKAVALAPDRSSYHSNLLMTLHYLPDLSPAEIAAEHRVWAERHAEPLRARIPIHANDRAPDRTLRIGYVSPDFRAHPIARFMLPILEQHERTQFEIYCYSDVANADTTTRQFMNLTPNWRHIAGATDATVADVVQEDKIDILVDLAAHSNGNRMLVFARKPAPVQITYLAYPGSTGQRAIDYRLTDRYFDPLPPAGEIYTERSLFLPETYWCYQPAATPPVNPTPSLTSGAITFGCLNNFSKVTPAILILWRDILRRVPDATLLLHAYEGSHRTRLREWFAGEGVDPQRICFVGRQSLDDYLATYHRIDIALDPFPYVGGTTTCDSLWMGVPVVTLTGRTAISRGGASILKNVGLPDLIAATSEDYIRIAVALAEDGARRQRLRADLRRQLQASPLMDAPRFVRALEAAYRGAWREWCSGSPATAV